jgi:hypothetical protein
LRVLHGEEPYVADATVRMREPRTGRVFEGRGAIAVEPHVAARMVLVGPGGVTALDMWITQKRWRFAAPIADFKRAGGTDGKEADGLPIGLFRWWFLAPLEGRLLTACIGKPDNTFVLRDGEATLTLQQVRRGEAGSPPTLRALRRKGRITEALEWRMEFGVMEEHVNYVHDATGLEVEVLARRTGDKPDPAAFLDPDGPGASL